jgi:hypothetical protein
MPCKSTVLRGRWCADHGRISARIRGVWAYKPIVCPNVDLGPPERGPSTAAQRSQSARLASATKKKLAPSARPKLASMSQLDRIEGMRCPGSATLILRPRPVLHQKHVFSPSHTDRLRRPSRQRDLHTWSACRPRVGRLALRADPDPDHRLVFVVGGVGVRQPRRLRLLPRLRPVRHPHMELRDHLVRSAPRALAVGDLGEAIHAPARQPRPASPHRVPRSSGRSAPSPLAGFWVGVAASHGRSSRSLCSFSLSSGADHCSEEAAPTRASQAAVR